MVLRHTGRVVIAISVALIAVVIAVGGCNLSSSDDLHIGQGCKGQTAQSLHHTANHAPARVWIFPPIRFLGLWIVFHLQDSIHDNDIL